MDINEILNKYYDEVKLLTENIRKYRCPSCGGEGSVEKECRYCHSENKELIDNITRIEEILKKITIEMGNNNISMKEILVNKLCNALCTISNHKENYIEVFLKECNYKNKFYSFFSKNLMIWHMMIIKYIHLQKMLLRVLFICILVMLKWNIFTN